MRKSIIIVISAACLTLLALTVIMRNGDLQSTLEHTQAKVRQAIQHADYDAFLRHTHPRSGQATVDRADFTQACGDEGFLNITLGHVFVDLPTQTRFLALKKAPGWAAYFAETELDDPNYAGVSVFLFKEDGRSWKACGFAHGLVRASPDSALAQNGAAAWKDRDEMIAILDSDPNFALEWLIDQVPAIGPQSAARDH